MSLKYARSGVPRAANTRSNYWPYAPLPATKAKLEARANVARAAATRSGYAVQWPFLSIGGADRSSQFDQGSLELTCILNQQANTGTVDVFGFDPSPAQVIRVASGAPSNVIFGGCVKRVIQHSVPIAGYKRSTVEFADFTWLLNRRRVTKSYAAGVAGNVVILDLMANFSSGFTTVNVQPGAPAISGVLLFRGELLSAALQKVADNVGWHWAIDPLQDIHFYLAESVSQPTTLRPTTSTYDSLEYQLDVSQVRTRVTAVGGGSVISSDTSAGAASLPVDETSWYSASGGQVIVNANLVTYTGRSTSTGAGNLTGCSGLAADVKKGNSVNLLVQKDDGAAQAALAAIEGGDGIHEDWIENSSWTSDAAGAYASATLAAFKKTDVRGTYTTHDIATKVGRNVTILLPKRGISVTVTTQRVVQRYIAKTRWEYQVDIAAVWSDLVDMITGAVRPTIGGTV